MIGDLRQFEEGALSSGRQEGILWHLEEGLRVVGPRSWHKAAIGGKKPTPEDDLA